MSGALAVRTVGELMNPQPVTVLPQMTVGDLLTVLEAEALDTVPVLDAAGMLCGIVTALDVLRLFQAGARGPTMRSLLSRRVGTIMRPGVITVEASDPIPAAVDVMVETRFHSLPVVRRKERGPVLVGVLHQRELVAKLSKSSFAAVTRKPTAVRYKGE